MGRAARGPCANPCGASRPSRPLPALQQNGSALCSFARSLFLFCHLPVAKHCWEPHVGDAAALFQAQEAAAAAAQGLGRSTRLPVRLPEPGRNRGRSGRGARLLPQPCPRRPGVRLGSAQTEPAPGGVWGEGGAPALAVRAPKQRGLGKLRPRVSAAPEAQGQAVGNAGGMGRGRGDAPDPARVGGDGGGDPCIPGGVPGWCSGSPLPSPSLGRARRCRVPGEACGELAGSPPLCVVSPPRPSPEREGSERTRGLSPTPALSQMQLQDPSAPPRPLPPPTPFISPSLERA